MAPKSHRSISRPVVRESRGYARPSSQCANGVMSDSSELVAFNPLANSSAKWGARSPQDAAALGEMVAAEPDRHDWRVVDVALGRRVCSECGDRLSRGPVSCSACDLAHGFRCVAIHQAEKPGSGQRPTAA